MGPARKEVATEFVVDERKRSLGLTLRDFAVREVHALPGQAKTNGRGRRGL